MKRMTIRSSIALPGAVVLLALGGCGDGTGPNDTGNLSVSTVTGGTEVDQDGYLLSVDGGDPGSIGTSATALVTELSEGSHTVLIAGVAPNCAVSGQNPRTVSVVSGQTAEETFAVTCSPTTGVIELSVATGGVDPDDAYTVSVDGSAPVAASASGLTTLTEVADGQHTLELGDVAANCVVSSLNPLDVSVTAGTVTSAGFDVSCVPAVGDLAVETITTGPDQDVDGYFVAVDGGAPQPAGIADTLFFAALAVGQHQIEITGLADNCAAAGPNPLAADVLFGDTASVDLAVTCTQVPLPSARIVFHSDRDGDFDIYSMDADGSNVAQLTNDPADDLFPAVSSSGQWVAFASNRDGGFSIYVMRSDGSNVTRVTSGSTDRAPSWSPDGLHLAFARYSGGLGDIFTVKTDGTELTRLTSNLFQDVEPAWSPDGTRIAFTTDRDGADEVYVMDAADGSNAINLTNHPGRDDDADWSPDGSLILFHRNDSAVDGTWLGDGEIMCMAADGSGVIRMTTDSAGITDSKPRWAPDGLWFVFSSDRDEGAAGNELYTALANGCTVAPASVNRATQSPGKDEFADWSS